MNKYILVVLVTLAFAVTAAAQTFGIKGAYHLSNMAVGNDQIDENNNKSGFSVGVINRYKTGFVIYHTELLWSRKGAKYSLLNRSTEVNANLDYLELPLSIGINILSSPLSIYGGVYGAFLLNANYQYEDTDGNEIAKYENRDAFNKLDFGLQTGIQLQFDNLLLDARFSRGLRDVEDDDIRVSNQTFLANEIKNYNLQLSAGILF